jgi:hypothetical protein
MASKHGSARHVFRARAGGAADRRQYAAQLLQGRDRQLPGQRGRPPVPKRAQPPVPSDDGLAVSPEGDES